MRTRRSSDDELSWVACRRQIRIERSWKLNDSLRSRAQVARLSRKSLEPAVQLPRDRPDDSRRTCRACLEKTEPSDQCVSADLQHTAILQIPVHGREEMTRAVWRFVLLLTLVLLMSG